MITDTIKENISCNPHPGGIKGIYVYGFDGELIEIQTLRFSSSMSIINKTMILRIFIEALRMNDLDFDNFNLDEIIIILRNGQQFRLIYPQYRVIYQSGNLRQDLNGLIIRYTTKDYEMIMEPIDGIKYDKQNETI